MASTVYPNGEPYAALGKLLRLPLVGRGVAVVLGALGGGIVRKGVEKGFHPDERMRHKLEESLANLAGRRVSGK